VIVPPPAPEVPEIPTPDGGALPPETTPEAPTEP